ncbi:threonine ammonia-lyase IlvA [Pontibacter fetidus]|uniref:L-threonine dehydratase n=1 Tax=Pontibacter fetidus TaxID=2700082 RepID=A0A6B2H917_9BACT|nr:threonine ammonia-lyase IlvA [Pontibacter fetidus]NDK55714.1 threonine ammonia-lyase IlvA [Pontibacter fetidus]
MQLQTIYEARETLKGVALHTPLTRNNNLSEEFSAQVYLKREDLQPVRSYKLRGAYNKIASLSDADRNRGVVCASAGNHAQGVAYACRKLNIPAVIFMPQTTPSQKVKQVRLFGKDKVEVVLIGDTFDDASGMARQYCEENQMTFIHPFDDELVIAGQGTVALEILADAKAPIDYLFVPIGGGGLAAGICTVFGELSPETRIIGVEPQGALSMQTSIQNGENTTLQEIDKFVDGAAVKRVGDLPFEICKSRLHEVVPVPEGLVCSTMLRLYNEEAMVVEPAGALTIAALEVYAPALKGKNVVCVVSGSNNDITRMEEIKERSLLYEGLKHYFVVNFPQRAGALREFLDNTLTPTDDITYFQYVKKHSRETGAVVIAIEVKEKEHFELVEKKMLRNGYTFVYLNNKQSLFSLLAL